MKGKMVIIDTNSGSLEQRATQNVYYHLRARFYDTGEALRNVRNIKTYCEYAIGIDGAKHYEVKQWKNTVDIFYVPEQCLDALIRHIATNQTNQKKMAKIVKNKMRYSGSVRKNTAQTAHQ